MAWTEEQISTYQIHNKQMLAEVNATLRPPDKNKLNIGIFAFGQNGDAMTCSASLKYKDELWPDKNIIWFCNSPVADVFKYNEHVNEIRPWPWAGNGLPIGSEDYWPMLTTEDNKLNQTLKLNFKDTADIYEGYFPCPFMLLPQKRHNLDYPNCSRKVFGIPNDYPWHPVLNFSDEEKDKIAIWFPPYDGINAHHDREEYKVIAIETFAGSGQTKMDDSLVRRTMDVCREIWKKCYFIFMSHKYLREQEKFPDDFENMDDVFFADKFSVRQCGLIVSYCDLMISVSSGITVAASAWGLKSTPIIQFTGSFICSTKSLANGRFELVTADNKTPEVSKKEFETKLIELLNQYK